MRGGGCGSAGVSPPFAAGAADDTAKEPIALSPLARFPHRVCIGEGPEGRRVSPPNNEGRRFRASVSGEKIWAGGTAGFEFKGRN